MSDGIGGDELILEHYRKQAEEHQLEPLSTMADETTRTLEMNAILACVDHAVRDGSVQKSLLEVGCGNGYLLQAMRVRFPDLPMVGVDYSPEMVALAVSRQLENCEVRREDVRALTFPDGRFDVIVTERCLINLLEEAAQTKAVGELSRVLKPGGFLVLIEAFTDGLANLNRARTELGLPENTVPYHNRWFEREQFVSALSGRFRDVPPDGPQTFPPRNFLSSHYFVSRVLYPSVTKREVLYNTEFVKFFRFLPPYGDFSPIQLCFLEKVAP